MKIQVQVLGLPHGNTRRLEKRFPLLFFCCHPVKTLCYFCFNGKSSSNRSSANIRLLSRTKGEEGKKTTDIDKDLICLHKL